MASRNNHEKLALAREKLKKYQRKQTNSIHQEQVPSTDISQQNNAEGNISGDGNEDRTLNFEVGVSPAAEGMAYEVDRAQNQYEVDRAQNQSFQNEDNQNNNHHHYGNHYQNQGYDGIDHNTDSSIVYPPQDNSQPNISQYSYQQEQDGNAEGGVEQYEYTAWEYQQYINSILQELASVKHQLTEYQQVGMTAATNIQQDPFQSSSNVDPASGLGLTNEMKTVLETANLEISQLQRQVEDSADLLNKTQQKCRGLQQENHSLQQRMSLLEEEDQLHIQDKSRLAKQIQESEKQLAHQHDLVNTLKAQISKLSSTEKDQSELHVELEGSRDAIKGLEIQVETMSSSLQHQKKQNSELSKKVALLEQELQVKVNELEIINQELSQSRNDMQSKVDKIAVLEKNDRTMRKKVVDLETLVEQESQRAMKSSKTVLENQSKSTIDVAAASNQMVQVTERCQILQEENVMLGTRLEELRSRNITLTNEKLSLSEKVSELESKILIVSPIGIIENSMAMPGQTSPSLPPIPYPPSRTSNGKSRRPSLEKTTTISKESDIATQLSTLTAKLLELDLENKRLEEMMAVQESLQLPTMIAKLEKQNGQLKNELEKELKVTILLQGFVAEVDALPDMIEKYHNERKALIQRINQAALAHSVKEKQESEKIKEDSIRSGPKINPSISCPQCLSNRLIQI